MALLLIPQIVVGGVSPSVITEVERAQPGHEVSLVSFREEIAAPNIMGAVD